MGGTFFLLTGVVDDEASLISIDLPGDLTSGPYGGGYPDWKIPLYKSFARARQKIYLIKGDSHDLNTFRIVKKILNDKKIDLLFIDGDHTYYGVKKDFEIYSPSVRKNEIIALHDIVTHQSENWSEVDKFWNEIKEDFKYMEIVRGKHQVSNGIGILFV